MSFDDKKFGTIFPVRDRDPIGTANERQMLDALGGSDSFRTRIQSNPDGSTTMLRTKNGMPQFTTTTPYSVDSCPDLYMESGVIDMVNTSDAGGLGVGTWFAGIAATATKWLGKVSNKIGHQGELKNVPTIGYSQDSKAVPVSSLLKKRVMNAVPASLYTGKMRLYVQAMYGREYVSSTFPLDINGNAVGIAPSLIYHVPTSNGSTDVSLTGNTGIYTDSEYRHWLVGINSTRLSIMLLICDACTEKLRPLLKTISGDEHERIEAYILSRSQPSGSPFHLPISVPTLYEFGYGWHFNWDGNYANIVEVVGGFNSDGGGTKYTSTHHRITVHRQETPLMVFPNDFEHWSANIGVIEGPSDWKNRTHSDVISYPDWVYGAQYVHDGHGSRFGKSFGNAAPFYCFYLRDELQVCRYSYTAESTSDSSIIDPPGFSPAGSYRMYISYGVHTYRVASKTTWGSRISVGSTSVDNSSWAESGTEEVGTFTWDGTISGMSSYNVPSGYGYNYLYCPGYPEPILTKNVVNTEDGQVKYNNQAGQAVHTVESTFSKSLSGVTLCVIPFYDAEAAYAMISSNQVDNRTSVMHRDFSGLGPSSSSVIQTFFNDVLVDTSYFWGTAYGGHPYDLVVTSADDTSTSTSTSSGKLVCSTGALEVNMAEVNVSDMQIPADHYGFSKFGLRTSAGKNYVGGFAIPSNLPDFPSDHPSSIVGWI